MCIVREDNCGIAIITNELIDILKVKMLKYSENAVYTHRMEKYLPAPSTRVC